jgi:protein-L-isoaspartate(D-aspartate) O-methyltransferase
MVRALDIDRERLMAQLAQHLPDGPVLEAMRRVPREAFVANDLRSLAYSNIPLPIGFGQTISQPLMVAKATQNLGLRGDEKVLEVGAGSGYQAAVLGELLPFGTVTSVERIPALAAQARVNLANCGIYNVAVTEAEDSLGYRAGGPYDAILVSAAAPCVPNALLEQLTHAGRLVIPVGGRESQTLTRVRRLAAGFKAESLGACRYVPLLGPGGWGEPVD